MSWKNLFRSAARGSDRRALETEVHRLRREVAALERSLEERQWGVRVQTERAEGHRQEAKEAAADRDMALRLLVGSADLTEEQWAAITDALARSLTPPGLARLRALIDEARRTRRAGGLEPGERVLAGGGAHPMTVTAVTADSPGRVRVEGRLDTGAPWTMHLNTDDRVELADDTDGTGEVHR